MPRRRNPVLHALFALALVAVWRNTGFGDDETNVAPSSPLWRHGMLVGVDYYPEHWPRSRWSTDLALMEQAGFNVVRLAEFSWAKLEPSEGRFDFAWLDDVLELCEKRRIRVILGTPTAIMPAWLADKYPEALSLKSNGTRTVWGGRRHNCFSDADFQRLGDRIVEKMAERYARHPAVIGWQIDNELGGADCCCPKCRAAFQTWLHNKYETLDNLNRSWGNQFWSLEVSDWRQIPVPDSRVGKWAISNPSASLDWLRFGSHLNEKFLNNQAAIIRRLCPDEHFVTHNLMGLHAGVDYYELAKELDFVSWDNYPPLHPAMPTDSALAADLMRGVKGRNFLIMEQTAGPLGWETYSKNPRPGELRRLCYQQLAHGADGQIWFRWRSCTAGREQYWHGLLGHDGKPGRRYEEATRVAAEYRQLEPLLAGTTVEAKVAVIYDYDSIWAMQIQGGYPDASPQSAAKRYYNALWRRGVGVDVVPPTADLSKYKLVLTPHLHVLDEETAGRLVDFVADGGVLLADVRTAVKNETNLIPPRTLPGPLRPALGIEIPEYESLKLGISDDAETTYDLAVDPSNVCDWKRGSYTAIKAADWIRPRGAQRVINYDEPDLRDYTAVTRNVHGQGIGWYVGAIAKEDSFYDALIAALLRDAGLDAIAALPQGVEATVRSRADVRLHFLINHTDETIECDYDQKGAEMILGTQQGGRISLPPFDVAVVRLAPTAASP